MPTKHWTRRDFVTQSTLAVGALGAVAGASASTANGQITKEIMMTYEDFVGQPLSEIPTPALLIDLDIFEKNMATMRDACKARGHLAGPTAKPTNLPSSQRSNLNMEPMAYARLNSERLRC